MGKVPLQVLKKVEHQARQNLSTIDFGVTFAKLPPLVTLLRTELNLPSKGLKVRFRRVSFLKKLPGVAMKMPVTILRSSIRES